MILFRFHLNEESVMDFIHNSSGAKTWFVVKETDANRPHYQGIIDTDKHIDTLRKYITRNMAVNGNADYSLKTIKNSDKDVQRTIQYLCKGNARGDGPDVIANTGMCTTVDAYHNAYWDENETIEKRKKTTVLQELLEWHNDNPEASKSDLAQRAMKIVVERNQTIRKHVIISWVDTCWFKKNGLVGWELDL